MHLCSIMSYEDIDIDSIITTFNTAATETASEILDKHCQKKKKTWVTADTADTNSTCMGPNKFL